MSSAGTLTGHPVLAGLTAAAEGLDTSVGGAVWQLTDVEVETALDRLLQVQGRAAAVEAMLLREAEIRDLKARTHASTVERWLSDRYRLSRADAAARHRAATGLGRHPSVQGALSQGEVTGEQATVLTATLDTVDALPGLDEGDRASATTFLLNECHALNPRDLRRAGQAVIEALTVTPSVDDPAGAAAMEREHARAEAEAQAAERNQLHVGRRRGRLRAILDLGTLGEAALQAFLRRADVPNAGSDGFEDTRSRSERRGDALVDLITTCAIRSGPAETLEDEPDESGRQQPLPGLAVAPNERPPISGTAVLTVTTTLVELQAGLTGAGRLDTGATVSTATLRQLACDALVVPAVLGSPSEVLDVGRANRDWNRAQRRAVALRDQGCVAPGCDQPGSACQVHHCWWWIRGGPTDIDNGALLCEFHHRMVHRQGWEVALARNGYPHLIPPPSIDPGRRPRQHHRFRLAPPRPIPATNRYRT